MKIREVLAWKGHEVLTATPGQTVADVVGILVNRDIGSLVVLDDGEVVGIITERDVLRLSHQRPRELGQVHVREVMTTDVLMAVPDDSMDYVMEIMTKNRIRHLPVLEEGRLVGLVSIGDVVNALRRDAEAENRHLRQYVQGMVW